MAAYMSLGFMSLRLVYPRPRRSIAPGVKFSTTTSTSCIRSVKIVLPDSVVRSTAIDRLPRFIEKK